jgi:hypothetical protein
MFALLNAAWSWRARSQKLLPLDPCNVPTVVGGAVDVFVPCPVGVVDAVVAEPLAAFFDDEPQPAALTAMSANKATAENPRT